MPGLLFVAYQRDPRTGFIKIFDKMAKLDALNQFVTQTAAVYSPAHPEQGRRVHWPASICFLNNGCLLLSCTPSERRISLENKDPYAHSIITYALATAAIMAVLFTVSVAQAATQASTNTADQPDSDQDTLIITIHASIRHAMTSPRMLVAAAMHLINRLLMICHKATTPPIAQCDDTGHGCGNRFLRGESAVHLDHADVQYRIDGVTLPSVGEGIGAFGDTLDTHFAQNIKLIDGELSGRIRIACHQHH